MTRQAMKRAMKYRFVQALLFAIAGSIALAQDPQTPVSVLPPAMSPTTLPVVIVSVPPLAPVDPNTPYASPRDSARHRLQASLAELAANRNWKDGLRGFEHAFQEDHTYAAAAFDLGILAAIAEKWDDAVAALEEASRLDPALKPVAAPQLERLHLIAQLEKSTEGRRHRAYDETLLPLLKRFSVMPVNEAIQALTELGRIDPKRWEAAALLAGMNGNGTGYQAASKFLEIALANASNAPDPSVRKALDAARTAAEREVNYSSARSAAEAASDQGDYKRAAELYQSAWTAIPARVDSGMNAASALLLYDDTQHASVLLARLRDNKDGQTNTRAAAMLKELVAIEPAAGATSSDASQFFANPGTPEPVRIGDMIPRIDSAPLEIYLRPLPKLVEDPAPVVLLSSLSVDNPTGSAPPSLPPPTPPITLSGDNPWREANSSIAPAPAATRSIQTADVSSGSPEARAFQVTSDPPGARVFIGTTSGTTSGDAVSTPADPSCETPCNLRVAPVDYTLRLSLPGYRDSVQTIQANPAASDVAVALEILRGSVLIDTTALASIKVNGTPLTAESAPVELSLAPGLYRIGADFGAGYRDRLLMVKAGARLHLNGQSFR
jgi:tetratricopeptide (TPR) repeat protein